MVDALFDEGIDHNALFKDVLQENIQANSIETQIMLLEGYDIAYGIFDHNKRANDDPYALIRLHPSESMEYFDPLYERLKMYMRVKVNKHLGLNFNEFINLPRDMVLFILKECAKAESSQQTQSQDIINQLESLNK